MDELFDMFSYGLLRVAFTNQFLQRQFGALVVYCRGTFDSDRALPDSFPTSRFVFRPILFIPTKSLPTTCALVHVACGSQ